MDVNLTTYALLVLSFFFSSLFPNAECSNGGDGNMGTAHSNSAQGGYWCWSVFLLDYVLKDPLATLAVCFPSI